MEVQSRGDCVSENLCKSSIDHCNAGLVSYLQDWTVPEEAGRATDDDTRTHGFPTVCKGQTIPRAPCSMSNPERKKERETTSLSPRKHSQTLRILVHARDGEVAYGLDSTAPTADVEDCDGGVHCPVAGSHGIDLAAHGAHVDQALAVVVAGDLRDDGACAQINLDQVADDDVVDEARAGDRRSNGPARGHLVRDVGDGQGLGEIVEAEEQGAESRVTCKNVVRAWDGGRAEEDFGVCGGHHGLLVGKCLAGYGEGSDAAGAGGG